MLAKLRKASDYSSDKWSDEEIITIEDLQKLDEKYGNNGLVVDFCRDEKRKGTYIDITIYDDYIE